MNTQILSNLSQFKVSGETFSKEDGSKAKINLLKNKGLIFLAGCVLGLSMPGFNFYAFAFLGLVPILLSVFMTKTYRQSAINSFIFGLGFNMTVLNWLLSIHPLGWMGLGFFQSAILATFIWLSISIACSSTFGLWGISTKYFIKLNINDVLKIFLISASWVILNNKLLSSLGPLSFPWAMIEYSQHNNLYFLQLASTFKGIGLDFYIVMFNTVFALGLFKASCGKFSKLCTIKYLLLNCLVLLLFHGFGFVLYEKNKISKVPKINIVQTDISMKNTNLSYFSLNNLKKYYKNRINQSPKGIVIFPEGAIPDFINQNDTYFIEELNKISKKQDKIIVLGYLNKYKNEVSNSAMIIDGNRRKYHYDKIHLVPFGETVPLEKYLPKKIKDFFSNSLAFRYKKGTKTLVIKTKYGNIAPSICYEIIFPELMQKQKFNHADLLINISNLGWFSSRQLKEQFVAFAKMRAVENRLPLAASINTGVSFVVDSSGKLLKIKL
jgi:apolipoprotein N-acyltransferase